MSKNIIEFEKVENIETKNNNQERKKITGVADLNSYTQLMDL